MGCVDALCAGDTAVILVSDTTTKLFAATDPNLTALAPLNPDPRTVTVVPPVVGPEAGDIEVTFGNAR